MDSAWLVLIAVWLWPISAFLLFRFLKERSFAKLVRWLWIGSLLILLICRLGISTRNSELDWALLTLVLLTGFVTLWLGRRSSNSEIKDFSGFGLVLAYLGCIVFGSIGILGLLWSIGELEPEYTHHLSEDLILKEYRLGVAVSDYRGLGAEVVKLNSPLPGFERRIVHEEYFDFTPSDDSVFVSYDSLTRQVLLHKKFTLNGALTQWEKAFTVPN
jgi:hypothetical protein